MNDVRLVACPRPFSMDRIERTMPEGLTVAQLFREVGLNPDPLFARVFIDGRLIPKATWETAKPVAGELVTVRVIPTDGGGGKDTARMVAMIGVMVAAIAISYGALSSILPEALAMTLTPAATNAIALGVMIGGTLAVNALIPPARPKLPTLSGSEASASPTLRLTGSSNQMAPYAPVPRVYGRHRIYPPLAARPYTEVVGADQYMRLIFCCGYGPLALDDFKIGETPLTQFQDYTVDVKAGHATDSDLLSYIEDVYLDALSIKVTQAAEWQYRRSQPNTKELTVDITVPSLTILSGSGSSSNTVELDVQYRAVGDAGDWTQVTGRVATAVEVEAFGLRITALTGLAKPIYIWMEWRHVASTYVADHGDHYDIGCYFASETTSAYDMFSRINGALGLTATVVDAGHVVRDGDETRLNPAMTRAIATFVITGRSQASITSAVHWLVPSVGQYDVRVRRITEDFPVGLSGGRYFYGDTYWSALRSLRVTLTDDGETSEPVLKPGLALIALRIKATNQLNGQLDQFNCVATSILPDWDGSSWVMQETSNPASIYRDILQGSANANPLADARLDLTTIQAFHERCDEHGFEFNHVVDYKTTVFELIRDVLAAGRGSFGLKDAQYSVVEDLAQDTPIQHFTPRNSWGFRGTRTFTDLPHALKMRFINEAADWIQDERIVYADGYSAANATRFETFDVLGVTNTDQAWKLGRYHLAAAQLRPETFELYTDLENLVCTRGDLVRVVHDVPLFGSGYGRIAALATDGGGNATGFTLDDAITMDAAVSYAVRFRKSDGTSLVQQVTTVAGEQSSFTFTASIAAANVPAVGDLALLGVLNEESVELLVKSIEPGPDLTAKLTLVDAAPEVLTADSGTIPDYDSHITLPANMLNVALAPPLFLAIQSDETVMIRNADGSLQSRIVLTLGLSSGPSVDINTVEVQWRVTGSQSVPWMTLRRDWAGATTSVVLDQVEDGASYDLRSRVMDARSRTSGWMTIDAYAVVGKTSAPPDVVSFLRNGEALTWAYPDAPIDFAGFRLRRHYGTRTSWDDAQPLHDGLITATRYDLTGDFSTITYLLKAVDVAGNESENPATLVINLGDVIVENLLFTSDKKADSWPGTHNGVVNAGNLEADTAGTYWSGNDGRQVWLDDADLYWVDQYLSLEYVASEIPDADKVPCTILLDLAVTAEWYWVEYRTSGAELFWSGTDANAFWSGTDAAVFWTATGQDWLPWPGRIEEATRQVYEWRVTTAPGATKGVLSGYDILIDVPDIVERMDDVAVSGAGTTRLTLVNSYRAIVNVRLTVQNDGGTAITARIKDKGTGGPPLTGGPNIECLDAAGAVVAGTVDADVQGY